MTGNVENIKERISIEEVVGQYVNLTPAGSNLKGKCPFHAEKTPSFMVSPARQTYHCFGCGAGGDIFTFIQEIEGLDFKGALKLLADKAGVELTFEKSSQKEDKDVLFAILEEAVCFYEQQLLKHTDASVYLQGRGLTEETIKSFRIGFAPDGWSNVLDHLKKVGFSEKHIEEAGLIKKGDKGHYDRFRSRIMFPITDSVGRVVAFSGRIFGKDDDKTGKYINSPETTLYHKSKVLYGYDRARQAIRKANFSILVEGQMDLIAVHQSKYTNCVALSGTALTQEQLTLLGRMSKNLCMALDADRAGIESAGKSARVALRAGFDVKVVTLPEGDDPADMLARGDVEEWKKIVKNSQHIIDFLLTYFREKAKDERSFKLSIQTHVLPYLLDITSEIDKSHFIQRVAAQLAVSEEAVRQELSKINTQDLHNEPSQKNVTQKEAQRIRAEEELVLMYLWQKEVSTPFIDLEGFKKQVEEVITPVGFNALKERLSKDKGAAFRFEELYDSKDAMKAAIGELLERLQKKTLEHEKEVATTALRKAESEGNEENIHKYMEQCRELDQRLAQLPNHL